jgi:hypothetical protein
MHKGHQYNLNQIKAILIQNDLTIPKADKGRTMVIIHKETQKQKIDNFRNKYNKLYKNAMK